MALSALLEDLQQRGMLEETLIVWVAEFGRKPQITPGNSGCEHWPFCYSGLMAGGGIRGGTNRVAGGAMNAEVRLWNATDGTLIRNWTAKP